MNQVVLELLEQVLNDGDRIAKYLRGYMPLPGEADAIADWEYNSNRLRRLVYLPKEPK